MSSALAIAAVTAVMKDLLDNAMIDGSIASVTTPVAVTALAPDLVEALPKGPRLNLFMYHVSPNQGWRNVGLPSRNGAGERTANAPLALDLHYMLTAYATEDFHAEILLGYAMQLLHEVPVLTRAAINKALSPAVAAAAEGSLPEKLRMLAASDLAAQVELVKITPEAMSTEEMSKLWAAINGHYRPTAAYRASVVLIESTFPTRAPLPVLTRGPEDAGVVVNVGLDSPYPALTDIATRYGGSGTNLDEPITISGHNLSGDATMIRLRNQMLGIDEMIAVPAAHPSNAIVVTISDARPDLRVGIYAVSVLLMQGGVERTTNEIPLVVAPKIVDINIAPGSPATVTLSVNTKPDVGPQQRATLIVGDREFAAKAHPDPTDTLVFITSGLATGILCPVRLRVDGIESILVNRAATPPAFVHTVTIP